MEKLSYGVLEKKCEVLEETLSATRKHMTQENELFREYIKDNNNLIIGLINNNGIGCCPKSSSYHGIWHEVLIEIDSDHTAQLRMDDETYQIIKSIIGD